MKKHVKIYLKHFDYGEQEYIPCESCQRQPAVDIHHIIYRSRGGDNSISNLMALCRLCHFKAHDCKLDQDYLQAIHDKQLKQ